MILVPFEGVELQRLKPLRRAVKEFAVVGDLLEKKRVGVIDKREIELAIREEWLKANVTFARSRRTARSTSLLGCSCPVTDDPNLSARTIPCSCAISVRLSSMANPRGSIPTPPADLKRFPATALASGFRWCRHSASILSGAAQIIVPQDPRGGRSPWSPCLSDLFEFLGCRL